MLKFVVVILPVLGGIDDEKVDQFVDYFEKTWLNENCHFPRST